MKKRSAKNIRREVKGWSIDEMKDKPSSSLEEDFGEMIEWRSMSQDRGGQTLEEISRKN